jgi:hypothetical protein
MAVPLLALGAIARLATLDDADASTALLSHLDTWAWATGILLILADLVLPVPQASVITALGAIYGIALGTLIGTVGLIFNGVAGYLLMSTPVRRVIERALKGRSAEAIAALSDPAGPWGIALSRSLPYSIPRGDGLSRGSGADAGQDVPRLAWLWQHLRGAALRRDRCWLGSGSPACAGYQLSAADCVAVGGALPDASARCRRCGGTAAA